MRHIKPRNNNGSIQIRFNYKRKPYAFNPLPRGQYKDARDLETAKSICTRINNDILAGHFDQTLNSYRVGFENQTSLDSLDSLDSLNESNISYLDLYDLWLASLDISEETKADHYRYIRKMLIKAKPDIYDVSWFIDSKLAPSTFNKRKSYLTRCFDWAVNSKLVSSNPWLSVKARKQSKELLEPFTTEELKLILEGFQTHKPYFYEFVKFLMLTGVRLSEAIGLQWKNINLDRGEITINESLPIDRTKNMYKRKRKDTKTGSIRVLTINEPLKELLQVLPRNENDDLVFHSCKGFTISDHQFRGVWKKVLELQGIPYRRPHVLRHTLLSMAIESGIPISGVAYIAGHSTVQTVIKTYLHIINRPNLPDIDI